MEDIWSLLWSQVQILAAAVSILASLVVGYVLRLRVTYPNARIPLSCIETSVLVYLLMCVPPAHLGDILSVVRYLVATIVIGGGIGMTAWQFHARLLKRFELSIPFLGDKLKTLDTPPTNP